VHNNTKKSTENSLDQEQTAEYTLRVLVL